MKKFGKHYQAHVEIAFESVQQAKNFCMQNTVIGERVALDLEDQEVLDLFDTEEKLICEITFSEGADPAVQEELDAARGVGAEIAVAFTWVENE